MYGVALRFPIHQEQGFYILFRYIYIHFPMGPIEQRHHRRSRWHYARFVPQPRTVICGKNFTLKDLISLIRGYCSTRIYIKYDTVISE